MSHLPTPNQDRILGCGALLAILFFSTLFWFTIIYYVI